MTAVYALKYESATQLVNVLRPLITPNNAIAALPTANALVITDYAENLRRIDKIIASLDTAPASEPAIVTLRYASALDITQILSRLLVESGQAGGVAADPQQRVTLVADPRSNSVLVRAESAARVARVRSLIEQLDTPGRAGGNIFIIYLKNAEAVRVAATLRSLLSGGGGDSATGGGLSPLAPAVSAGGTSVASPIAAPALGSSGVSGSSTSFTAGNVTIQADSANNALIVMAPEPMYNNIRAVVEKLDNRRAQVFVEALIVEVSAERAAEFGIQWQYLQGANSTNSYVGGGTNFGVRGTGNNIIDTSLNLGSAANGLNLGIIRGSITIPGLGTITNLALLVRALQGDNTANILATPNLLTLDNEEAKIVVAQNVPFITGQYAQTGSTTTVTPFQTIERKDVGLILRVQAADHRGRHGAACDLRRGLARAGHDESRGHHHQQALARIDRADRRRPDHRAWRPDPGQPDRRHAEASVPRRHTRCRGAVSLRHARAQQDQPDGVPSSHHRAQRSARRGDHQRSLRLRDRRAAQYPPRYVVDSTGASEPRRSADGRSDEPAHEPDAAALAGAAAMVPAAHAFVAASGRGVARTGVARTDVTRTGVAADFRARAGGSGIAEIALHGRGPARRTAASGSSDAGVGTNSSHPLRVRARAWRAALGQ